MSLKSIWDRIRSVAAGASAFLVSDEQRAEAQERVRRREEWERKRATRRPRHGYRVPKEIFDRTHYRHRVATDDKGKLPRQAATYRAARRNAQRTGKAGGMGNAVERGAY